MIVKILRLVRGLLFKTFSGHPGWKSCLGKPLCLLNMKRIRGGERVRIYPGIRLECFRRANPVMEEACSIGRHLPGKVIRRFG